MRVSLPTLSCEDASYRVAPGTCIPLVNPCEDGQWVPGDAFTLRDPPAGVSLHTRSCSSLPQGELCLTRPERELCAAPNTPGVANHRSTYLYSRGEEFGGGGFSPPALFISVPTPLILLVTASPTVVDVGECSDLSVLVSGGVPLYTFAWAPLGGLNNPRGRNTSACSLSQPTTYTVTVRDILGTTAMASVTVNVNQQVNACFIVTRVGPSFVDLDGNCSNGLGLTYRWWCDFLGGEQPPDAEGNIFQFCSYESGGDKNVCLEVVDSSGNSEVACQTITVPRSNLTACFTLTPVGTTAAQADASCSTGNKAQYNWWLDFRLPDQPPDVTSTTPVTILEFEHTGQNFVRLEVVDNTGATAAVIQSFFVQPPS